MSLSEPSTHRCRIVLTGGPGGGKTTAADLFRREMGEAVVIVPEAATMMFTGGFPRYPEHDAVRSAQLAIYHVQRNLEDIQATRYPDRILLCDRGTIDGAATRGEAAVLVCVTWNWRWPIRRRRPSARILSTSSRLNAGDVVTPALVSGFGT